ncbi:(2Fe-2S)-binding protein [Halobacteriales archaeon QS_8_69_26]|nr:MAG: (2Fe-2S)-binding protein [Halobacteriales archaeon QS_8_69_26]
MAGRYRLTSVEDVVEEGSWLFTVRDEHGNDEEVFLVPCGNGTDTDGENGTDPDGGRDAGDDAPGVEAWVNRCTHEAQRLHREGIGAVVRNGGIVCPKHGSTFDACSGYCDNGDAADTTLVSVDVTVEDGSVYLTDDDVTFLAPGSAVDDDDDDEGPSSTSHLQL